MVFSAPVPLLISRDPYEWLQANIIEHLYEGTEEVAGHCCHRICFLQEGPPIAVTLWIDCESGLLRKQTVVKAETERGTPVWAMATAARGLLVQVILDEISTAPAKLARGFDTTPPANVPSAESVATQTVPPPAPEGSFLQRLLRAAVSEKLVTTSATIEDQWPAPRWQVAKVFPLQARVAAVRQLSPQALVFLLSDGTLWHIEGAEPHRIQAQLGFVPSTVASCREAQKPAVALAAKGKPWLALVSSSGQLLWQRRLPRAVQGIECSTFGTTTTLCVTHTDGYSCLDLAGRTTWSFRSEEDLQAVMAARHPSHGDVFVGLSQRNPMLQVFAPCGRPTEQLHLDDPLVELLAPTRPMGELFLVGALSLRDNEFILRGIGPQGETLWTTPIAAKLERFGGGFTELREQRASGEEVHFVAVTPTGRLREVDAQGRLVWEGQLRLDVPPAMLAGLSLGDTLAKVDLDRDGQDEILLFAEKKLLYLVPLPGRFSNSR